MQTAVSKINNINTKKVLISLIFAVAFLFSSYIYFIIQTTVNITTNQNAKEKIINLDSHLGSLEFEYMSLKKAINLKMAQTLGYIEASNISYIDKDLVNNKKLSLVN